MNTGNQMHHASQGQDLASDSGDFQQEKDADVSVVDEVKAALESKEETQTTWRGLVDAVKRLHREVEKGAEEGREAAHEDS